MEKVSDNVFRCQVDFNATKYFAFSTVLADNNDEGGWAYVNAHRYAGTVANATLVPGEEMALVYGVDRSMQMTAGKYNITVDLNTMKVSAIAVVDQLFEIGDNQGWHPAQAIEMTNKSENVFEGTFEFTGETSYFAFITVKPETDDWTVTNANRFGGATNNELIADGGTYNLAMGELCLTAAQGKYTITVDMTAKTASVVKETEDGLENINGENNVQKVIENGHVYIIRDGVRYTATGARVE
jgi:hypothetical protein